MFPQRGPVVRGPVVSGPVVKAPVPSGPVLQAPVASGPVLQAPVASGPVPCGPVLKAPRCERQVQAHVHGVDAPRVRHAPGGTSESRQGARGFTRYRRPHHPRV
eukprot:1182424-Prorocentrum_minimum.AAC.1